MSEYTHAQTIQMLMSALQMVQREQGMLSGLSGNCWSPR